MTFWIAAFLIVAAVTALLLGALRAGGPTGLSPRASDIGVYRDQLKEIERDIARGVLSETEAEPVRIEISRRLLEADRRAAGAAAPATGRATSAGVFVLVLLFAGAGLYGLVGAPGRADLPMADRVAALEEAARTRPSQEAAETRAAPFLPVSPEPDPAFTDLMTKLRAALEARPDDIQGLRLLAENEVRLGNFSAGRAAQERLIAVLGDAATPDDLMMGIEIMVYGAGGYVSPEAETYIVRLLAADPQSGAGRYYAGRLQAQNGRPDLAFPIWRRLLETSAPDAPWLPVIRDEISGLAQAAGVRYELPASGGPSAADIARASEMSPEDRQTMIRGMVEGLAERLASEGGPPEDWARLITALGVLGETDRARAIADEARGVFASDAGARDLIEGAAERAGVSE